MDFAEFDGRSTQLELRIRMMPAPAGSSYRNWKWAGTFGASGHEFASSVTLYSPATYALGSYPMSYLWQSP